MQVEHVEQAPFEFKGKRLLIFVLGRIPRYLQSNNVEVLIIDDASQDNTFRKGLHGQRTSAFKITVLRTPKNQGYGGNQKLGYHYAIDNGFDIVALVHGDGQ
jgi:glycosyltransferase involved in cell wall biosynthesis